VYYNVTNFLEKNKDSLHPDVMSCIRASSDSFLTDSVLPKPPPSTPGPSRGGKGGSKKQTLGSQFKEQQQALMKTLNATYPHFVRCMKPNKVLKGSVFEEDLMLAQVRG
jgi:myosin V